MPHLPIRHLLVATALAVSACDCGSGDDTLATLEPKLVADPGEIDFDSVPVGDSKSTTIRLTNDGESVLRISKSTLDNAGGAFALDRAVPTEIAPSQTVELGVTFVPDSAREFIGSLRLESNDKASPHVLNIRGLGIVPRLTVAYDGRSCAGAPNSLSVGKVEVNRSAEKIITLAASGDSTVIIESVELTETTSNEWTLTGVPPPGTMIPPGESLSVTLAYNPTDLGPDSARIVVKSNSLNKPEVSFGVCAEGIEATLCADPVPLDLGPVVLGTKVDGTVEISNCGSTTVDVNRIVMSSDAAHPSHPELVVESTPTLPANFEPNAAFEVTVSLTPTALGPANGFLEVETGGAGGPKAYVPVTARAVEDCAITVAPERVNFGVTPVGGQTERQVLLANASAKACTVLGLVTTATSGFAVGTAPTTPFVIASGASEVISLRYQPAHGGLPDHGVLRVQAGRQDSTAALVGNSAVGAGCQLEVVPPFLNFNAVARGTSATAGVRLENRSGTPCSLNGVNLDPSSDPGFINPSQPLGTINPGEGVNVQVTYRPFRIGPATGRVRLSTTDVDTPQIDIQLIGLSPPPSICVTPRQLAFGPSTAPRVLDLTIEGCSPVDVTVTDVAFTEPDSEFTFVTPPAVPFTLQPGQQQVVRVRYTPADAVGDTAKLAIGSDDPADPIVYVTVTGGPELAPPEAGRFLYYWQIFESGAGNGANIARMPLQGALVPQYYYGPETGQQCAGCHTISSDGRYLAIVGEGNFQIVVIDTEFDVEVTLPHTVRDAAFVSWRPDPNTSPPYQLVYSDGERIHKMSIFSGYLGEVMGASTVGQNQKMATWGPNGTIAYVRCEGSWFSCYGPVDIFVIDENGGVPVPLNGVNGGSDAKYYPQYSPDGTWIAYTYSAQANSTMVAEDALIRLVRTDQSGTIATLPAANGVPCSSGQPCGNSFPTWSKDGRFLSFSSNRPGSIPANGRNSWDLYIAPIDPATGADGPAYPVDGANSPEFEHAVQWGE